MRATPATRRRWATRSRSCGSGLGCLGVLVGDRGMLTQPQIDKLQQRPGLGWITALTSGAIRKLVEKGALQLSLLDEQNLAEITSPDYPGERLVVCHNPLLEEERARKRQALLEATEKSLAKIAKDVARRKKKLLTAAEIGLNWEGAGPLQSGQAL